MESWIFWLSTSGLLLLFSTMTGLIIYYIKYLQKRRDLMEVKLIDSIDALKDAISQLKLSIGTITVGCYEKHQALNRDVEDIRKRLLSIETLMGKE